MNHSGAESDHKITSVEVIKDKNGIEQVVLRNVRGASATVTFSQLFRFQFQLPHPLF